MNMQLEIRSDLTCSLRHIGKRRLERALGLSRHQSEIGLIEAHPSLTSWSPTGSGGRLEAWSLNSKLATTHRKIHQRGSPVWPLLKVLAIDFIRPAWASFYSRSLQKGALVL